MSKRRRTVIGILVVELLLAGLWYYLHAQADPNPEFAARLGRTMGSAMGLILGLSPALYLLARRNDLKGAEGRQSGG